MKFSGIATSILAVTVTALIANPIHAQLPVLGGGAAAAERAQAQTQQRIQAQVQQRTQAVVQQRVLAQAQAQVQAQVQAQAQAQVQARLQADAARAVNIAQRSAIIAQRQAAAAKQRATGSANARIGANVNARSQAEVGNQSAEANLAARLGIQAGLAVPADLTIQDVQVYDQFFGRFNPLRAKATSDITAAVASTSRTNAETVRDEPNAPEDKSAVENPERTESRRDAATAESDIRGELDLTSRIEIAARQRRAEISEMRDKALVAGDAQMMMQAERMEDAMNAFVEAQARAQAHANSEVDSRTRTAKRPNVKGRAERAVEASGKTQSEAQANGNANASGNAILNR